MLAKLMYSVEIYKVTHTNSNIRLYVLLDAVILGASTRKQLEENIQSMTLGPLHEGICTYRCKLKYMDG